MRHLGLQARNHADWAALVPAERGRGSCRRDRDLPQPGGSERRELGLLACAGTREATTARAQTHSRRY